MVAISDTAARALYDAVAHKGKHKGLLLAKAPRSNTLAYAAWQGAMINCNPYKASIAGIAFMDPAQREVYREIDAVFEQLGIRSLDRDRNALDRLGVW